VWHNRAVLRTKFTNVVILDDHVYGLSDGILECVALATGERVWKDGRYHHGQILLAGRHLLVQSEDGEVVLVSASPERPNDVRGRVQALDGPSWNNLALYGPYLVVRNAREAAVYRLPLAEGTPSS
jgi:outer membrane protein assembly factor BamB